jgi:tetratricopeptide (TPR) repeat protein
MRRTGWIGWLILALWTCFLLAEGRPAQAEGPVVGKLVTLQGRVGVRAGSSPQWQPARINQALYAGDSVRTGPASRASILCVDESQIKLNENTIVILKSIAPSSRLQPVSPVTEKPPSHYEVPEGEIWLRNKNEKFRFELETPAVTATIRGTELNVKVGRNGTTSVILLEGNVCLTNPQGEVCLRPGEEGYTVPGQKPGKRMLVQPDDAVQWCLYYPGIFSYRDLPLAALPQELRTPAGPRAAALVQKGENAYDRGQLEAARRDAEAALQSDPENSRALTLLGWISLQQGAPEAGLAFFRRVRQPDDLTRIGLALCRYRLGEVTGAYEYLRSACQQPRPEPLLATMCGYFALMVGKVDQARAQLEAVPAPSAIAPLARALLAQIYLVQNRKDAALKEATAALARAPDSPIALLSTALVKMAFFDLRTATRYLEKAIRTDPGFVSAYVYLAKIWLGSEYLSRAQKTIDQALHLAPKDPQVLSLAGFVRLAYRNYRGALEFWNQAVKLDPKFGEPHLGLAIYHFRYREFHLGLEEMLTATLLDPRVSSYQTELGKALYQVRSFDRALEVFQYAKTLDPKDPTPYFYEGIALSDLNRPGDAVQQINKSIELNDNVAMFRSRNLLDQDLAVRNYSLAKAYQQLGLRDWAYSKAVTAVKYQPYNSSAHLFLRDAVRGGSESPFLTPGLLFSSEEIEGALFRVLSPANQATFTNLTLEGTEALGLTYDYTPMFEMPYGRVVASGGIGVSEGSKSIQDHQGFIYGGLPGVAFEVSGRYTDNRGIGRPSDIDYQPYSGTDRTYRIETGAKWEPTVHGTITGFFQYGEQKLSEQAGLNVLSQGSPVHLSFGDNQVARFRFYELAYLHRFNPQLSLLGYFAHRDLPFHLAQNSFTNFTTDFFGFNIPGTQQSYLNQTFDREYNNVQIQKHLLFPLLGQHTLISGFDYFSSNVSQRINLNGLTTLDLSIFGLPPFTVPFSLQNDYRPPFWSYSFYLLDYWRLQKNLVLELGLFKDFNKTPRIGVPDNIYTSLWCPRFGANYQFRISDTQHTLRLALERHLTTHLVVQPLLVPSEVAGFPWAIDANSGAELRQAGFAWETQWDPKTFTSLRLNALRVSTPDFLTDDAGFNRGVWHNWQRYQGSLVLNRILASSLGLSLGVLGKRVIPDLSYQNDFFPVVLQDYYEFEAFMGLAYLHRQGWLARIRPYLVQQFLKNSEHGADSPFVILNLSLGREFPNKRGFALFEIQNLFNRQPFYSLEPARSLEFSTQRRFLFRLAFYF